MGVGVTVWLDMISFSLVDLITWKLCAPPGADRRRAGAGDGEPDGGGDSWRRGAETEGRWPQRTRRAAEGIGEDETGGRAGEEEEQWSRGDRQKTGGWTYTMNPLLETVYLSLRRGFQLNVHDSVIQTWEDIYRNNNNAPQWADSLLENKSK